MSNINIIRNLYQRYQKNHKIDERWKSFFSNLDEEAENFLKNQTPKKNFANKQPDNEYTANSLRARLLIRAYRIAGHLKADLDPLRLTKKKIHTRFRS